MSLPLAVSGMGLPIIGKMLGHSLACHLKVLTQFTHRAAVVRVQPIQQLPATWVSERFEYQVRCQMPK